MVEEERLKKAEELRAMGANPYPYRFDQTHHAEDIVKDFAAMENKKVGVAGRIVGMRKMGKLYFLDLLDGTGRIQVLVRAGTASENATKVLALTERGDIVGVEGTVTKSKSGEISVDALEVTMLAKSLRTMPEKFHGLSDIDVRYRKRYLDLISNPDVRRIFLTRTAIISYIRNFLDDRKYVEVETPILQPVYGGGNAKPFNTFHNALDAKLYLRISNELYLKRLIIGGIERVYEFSKDFRNEDIDTTHNPEFTSIELYEAYGDYETYMKLVEELFSGLAQKLFGKAEFDYQGKTISFKAPFKRIYFTEEVKRRSGVDIAKITDDDAEEIIKKEKLETKVKNAYHVADAMFDKYIKPEIEQPTFVLDYPSYMCPLTKDKRGNSALCERFELFMAGQELANAYSELTDPVVQRRKFEEQDAERRKGDDEMPPIDDDFLEAIEYGMPPTAGVGIGIDRLVMLLTNNVSIKEVILFPSVRPENRKVEKLLDKLEKSNENV